MFFAYGPVSNVEFFVARTFLWTAILACVLFSIIYTVSFFLVGAVIFAAGGLFLGWTARYYFVKLRFPELFDNTKLLEFGLVVSGLVGAATSFVCGAAGLAWIVSDHATGWAIAMLGTFFPSLASACAFTLLLFGFYASIRRKAQHQGGYIVGAYVPAPPSHYQAVGGAPYQAAPQYQAASYQATPQYQAAPTGYGYNPDKV